MVVDIKSHLIEGAVRNKSANKGSLLIPTGIVNDISNNTYREKERLKRTGRFSFGECSENLLVAIKLYSILLWFEGSCSVDHGV